VIMSKRLFAFALGLFCHLMFISAVGLMSWSIFYGMTKSIYPIGGDLGRYFNLVLLVQFPLFHSMLLTKNGQSFLRLLTLNKFGYDLNTTWFALISSAQLLFVFVFWTPSSGYTFSAQGMVLFVWGMIYFASWILLAKSMYDASLPLQLGALGWMAVSKGKRPKYPGMPMEGTFRVCRQPIYLSFFLIILTAPFWSVDHLILLILWGAYCFVGPMFKEKRYQRIYGDTFSNYKEKTPYMIPIK